MSAASPFPLRVVLRIIAAASIVLLLQQLWVFHGTFPLKSTSASTNGGAAINDTVSSPSASATSTPAPPVVEPRCDRVTGLDDVLVVLRTGATEALQKLPVHFNTTLACVPNYVIFSDFEEDIDGHHVHDVFRDLNPDLKATNPDFQIYNRLLKDGRAALAPEELEKWASTANTQVGMTGNPAWKLDKWKFLPLVERALAHRPKAKWFVFVEADTYMSYGNLGRWLGKMDPAKPYFVGEAMQIGDTIFAYGGSGFVISNPAMRMLVDYRREHRSELEAFNDVMWAGDCVLGKAMADAGVPLTWAWPNLQGRTPAELDFEGDNGLHRLWCHHAVSYHHMSPQDIRELWEWEQIENLTHPRFSDLYYRYVSPRLAPSRPNWDNFSPNPPEGAETTKIDSFEKCRRACEAQPDCLQFSYAYHSCKVSSTLLLGRAVDAETEGVIASGWMMDRVEDRFGHRMNRCRRNEKWVLPDY